MSFLLKLVILLVLQQNLWKIQELEGVYQNRTLPRSGISEVVVPFVTSSSFLWLSAKTWCFITLSTVLEVKTKTNQILGFCHNPGRVVTTLCDITESNQMTFPTYWEFADRLETHFSRRDMQRVNFASYLMAAGHLLVSDPLCWTSLLHECSNCKQPHVT